MAKRHYIIDTSYLLELFRVDGCCEPSAADAVQRKFDEANDQYGSFYVPIPVLFELANHIADVKNYQRRKVLAESFCTTIVECLKDDLPWIITPPGNPQTIRELVQALHESTQRFSSEFSEQKLGLTDAVVIMEAERLKKAHPSNRLKQVCVHIWTRHKEMKAHEPDAEPDPFV